MDPRLFDPEKVFEDGFLLTKMLDDISAEIQTPYLQRRVAVGFKEDIHEEIKDLLEEITKREKEMGMLLKFINMLTTRSRTKINDLKIQIEQQKRLAVDYKQERDDINQRLKALEEARENLEVKNQKLESFVDELEKNYERTNEDLKIANQELERIQRAKDDQEINLARESTASSINSYRSEEYAVENTDMRTVANIKKSNLALKAKNKALEEELNSLTMKQESEDYYKELYNSTKAELDDLTTKKLSLIPTYEKQLKDLKDRHARLSFELETAKLAQQRRAEAANPPLSSRRRKNNSNTIIAEVEKIPERPSINRNAKIYEKMMQQKQDEPDNNKVELAQKPESKSSPHKRHSLWNEIIDLHVREENLTSRVSDSSSLDEESENLGSDLAGFEEEQERFQQKSLSELGSAPLSNLLTETQSGDLHRRTQSYSTSTTKDTPIYPQTQSKGKQFGIPQLRLTSLSHTRENTPSDLEFKKIDVQSKATQTDIELSDEIVEESEEKEEDDRTSRKKIVIHRKDALEEYFIMTTQCAKLNSPHFNDISMVDAKSWYKEVLAEEIPFHRWYTWIEDRLNEVFYRMTNPETPEKYTRKRIDTEVKFDPLFTKWMKITYDDN